MLLNNFMLVVELIAAISVISYMTRLVVKGE